MPLTPPCRLALVLGLLLGVEAGAGASFANPSLVFDVDTGQILSAEQPTRVWFPASLSKLMTAYVALKAEREGRVRAETPFVVSARAARMAPSKMGFRPGTEVTLDNALKMLMVKSANDIAVVLAEGLSGSVEAFADEMNSTAAALGMRDSKFYNPNGLPDARQVSSARDLAVLARALYRDFPEKSDLWGIGALSLGDRIIPTHNGLMGRYPGVDGMKTGFTCAAGFNVVASARRGGRHLVAVILGAPSAKERTAKAAVLFDKGFAGAGGGLGDVDSLGPNDGAAAPDIRGEACVRRAKGGLYLSEIEDAGIRIAPAAANQERVSMFETTTADKPAPAGAAVAELPRPTFAPVPVFVGRAPGYVGPVMQALAAPTKTRQKPATASAYAPDRPDASASPLAPDAAALPLRLSGAKAKPAAKVKAAAPKPAAPKPSKTAAVKPSPARTAGAKPKPAAPVASPAARPAAPPATQPADE